MKGDIAKDKKLICPDQNCGGYLESKMDVDQFIVDVSMERFTCSRCESNWYMIVNYKL